MSSDYQLERYLKMQSEQDGELPQRESASSYFDIYISAKQIFEKYYKDVDLAANIEDSPGTVYTKHGRDHINELIKQAGSILGAGIKDFRIAINGYECFLLLMAILVHDLGMRMGREGHEDKIEDIILTHHKEIGISLAEAKIIHEIAAAHTGRDPATKEYIDTFSNLEPKNEHRGIPYRKRVVAALVRLSDELSDNSERAHEFVGVNPNVSDESKLRHAYCRATTRLTPDPSTQTIVAEYYMSAKEAIKMYATKDGEISLIEHIIACLQKMDQERIYCTRYFAEAAYLSTIEAQFNIYTLDEYNMHSNIVKERIKISDVGYPPPRYNIKEIFKSVLPDIICERYYNKTGEKLR